MQNGIATEIRYLKGIGPKRAKLLNRLGISSVEDLLYYFPRRYEDRTNLAKISNVRLGEYQAVKGKILRVSEHSSFHSRLNLFEVIVGDETGQLSCVWFNQHYLKQYLSADKEIVLYGKLGVYNNNLQMQSPEYEIIDEDTNDNLNYGRIVPLYSLTENLSQRMFRKIVKFCLNEYLPKVSDILPYDIRSRRKLLNIASSILNMHFPQNSESQEAAYKRILFEECFLLQLMFGLRRWQTEKINGIEHKPDGNFLSEFEKGLPFELTSSQKKVMAEIKADMISPKPMHRLLQGDVGSGKTIVALYASMIAVSSGHQVAFMAPTEILATQHYESIKSQVISHKLKGKPIKAALLTSSATKKEKEKVYRGSKDGNIDIVIGTHSLIEESLEFENLSLVVIDEQHKFGVHQRLSIFTKGANPDCLIMTATPIPRTLAMSLYADLDISTITELPKNRFPVKTYLVDENKREWVYDFVRGALKEGRQAYIVYSIIDESKVVDLKAAAIMYEELKRNVFADFKVGLVHGRLKQKERDAIMQAFKSGEIDLLVSTVVIEVGIDISNASVMVIEHAERFGLSQLHQLRGRIGRGSYESHCILIGEPTTEGAVLRLKAIAQENDGFKIAEKDLEIRGPGEFFGVRQHGIPELRVNPLGNLELINIAKEEARNLLLKDPLLNSRQNEGLLNTLKNRFPNYNALINS